MKDMLLKLMIDITRHPRYRPDVEWNSKSWTHNIFRVYELIFGRCNGVRAELSARAWIDENGQHVIYACHSWESVFALTEQYVREFLSSWRFVPFKIYIPILQTPQGIPVFASPYLFAIALDTSAQSQTGTATPCTISFSYTCTGSNLVLWEYILGSVTTLNLTNVSGATYNSVSMTSLDTINQDVPDRNSNTYILTGPATGSNTSATTFTSIGTNTNFQAIALHSYSGCAQSGQPDSHSATATTSASATMTATFTTVANNCWLVAGFRPQTIGLNPASSGTGSVRQYNNGGGWATGDSNGAKGTGSQTFTIVGSSGTGDYIFIGCSIAPFTAAVVNSGFFFAAAQ